MIDGAIDMPLKVVDKMERSMQHRGLLNKTAVICSKDDNEPDFCTNWKE